MITFKQHIELNKLLSSGNGIDSMFKNLDIQDRLSIIRGMDEVYPIKKDVKMEESFPNDFTIYEKVMDLHLGQFIMLEQIITGKENFKFDVENDFELAKLILRPKHHKEFDNEDQEVEKKNIESILSSDVRNVYSAIYKYMENREFVLFNQFSGVFYNVEDYDEEEEEQKSELVGEDLFHSQWYWYNIVRTLAQEDIRRYQDIYMLKMSVVLPEMSFLAQRNKIEQAKSRQQQMTSKL